MHLNDTTIHSTSHFVYFLQVAHFKDGGHWENSWAAWRSKDLLVATFWFSADGCKNGVAAEAHPLSPPCTVLQFWTESLFDGEFENKAITFIKYKKHDPA